jgi:hypothetical protein
LAVPHATQLFFSPTNGTRVFAVGGGFVELWELGLSRQRVSTIRPSTSLLSANTEITLSSIHGDRLFLVTKGWWLTIISVRRDRLFVSGRSRLMQARPHDWSLGGDHLAFAMADGTLLVTASPVVHRAVSVSGRRRISDRSIPDSPLFSGGSDVSAPPEPAPAIQRTSAPVQRLSRGQGQRQRHSSVMIASSMGRLPSIPAPGGTGGTGNDSPLVSRRRRNSFGGTDQKDDLLKEIVAASKEASKEAENRPGPAKAAKAGGRQKVVGAAAVLALSMQVTAGPLDRVEWVSRSAVVAWSKSASKARHPIHMVDLRTRKISPLLGKLPGMTVTDVVFSENRKYWAVIVNGFIVSFFQSGLGTRPVGSVAFEWPVFIAFDGKKDAAVFVSNSGIMGATSRLSVRRATVRITPNNQLDMKNRGNVTAVLYRNENVLIGTSTGLLMRFEPSGIFKEVAQMRAGIVRFIQCQNQAMLAIDEGNHALFLSSAGEHTPINVALANATMCGPVAFLMCGPNDNHLHVRQLVGWFKPAFPVAMQRCPSMRPLEAWRRELTEDQRTPFPCDRFGLPLLEQIRVSISRPELGREHLEMLLGILARTTDFPRQTLSLAVLLDARELCQDVLKRTDPQSPAFVANMMKWAILASHSDPEVCDTIARHMIASGFADEAIDLYLFTRDWEAAVDRLLELNRPIDAAVICRVYRDVAAESECTTRLAAMLGDQGAWAFKWKLLAELGRHHGITSDLFELNEPDQASLISRLG